MSFALILRVFFALIFFGSGVYHFINPNFYLPLMPDILPAHKPLIYLSGLVELAVAVGLFIPSDQIQRLAVWGVIGLLVVFTPVHIIDYFRDDPYVGSKTIAAVRLLIQAVMLAAAASLL
ncbi:MAG: DoxX family protein [Anaerolineae bacterium]